MQHGNLSVFLAILAMALVTYGTRVAGVTIMSRVTKTRTVEAFLDAMSNSVIIAIVATVLARGTLREAVAVAVAALVMLARKSAIWAMVAGMAVAALWRAFLS